MEAEEVLLWGINKGMWAASRKDKEMDYSPDPPEGAQPVLDF